MTRVRMSQQGPSVRADLSVLMPARDQYRLLPAAHGGKAELNKTAIRSNWPIGERQEKGAEKKLISRMETNFHREERGSPGLKRLCLHPKVPYPCQMHPHCIADKMEQFDSTDA